MRHRLRWTAEEIEQLRQMALRRASPEEMGAALDRAPDGCKQMAYRLVNGTIKQPKPSVPGGQVTVVAPRQRAPVPISLGGPAWSRPQRYQA